MKTKVYYKFLLWLKRATHESSKVAVVKQLFSGVCVMGATCFDESFLFSVTTGRHCF